MADLAFTAFEDNAIVTKSDESRTTQLPPSYAQQLTCKRNSSAPIPQATVYHPPVVQSLPVSLYPTNNDHLAVPLFAN